ncbi:MAG: hypothetical protein AAB354_06720, partial [candidate division KSB1 bacterium]
MNRNAFLLAAVLAYAAISSADQKYEIASPWRNVEVKVDGDAEEWAEAFSYLEKEKLGFGLKNDSSALYLCLRFDEATQRQALRFGFTIWLDASGKNKKAFGIRFPLGMMNYDKNFRPDPAPLAEGGNTAQFTAMLRELEIIGPEKDERKRVPAFNAFGIAAAASQADGELVCELSIPLQSVEGQSYALAAELGQTLSIGFEMGELNRELMRERIGREPGFGGRPGGPPGGGFPGGGGPPGGRPRGGFSRPPGLEQMPSSFKVWKRVHLAANSFDASQSLIALDELRVTLQVENVSLREALQKVVSQTKLQIVYSDALV